MTKIEQIYKKHWELAWGLPYIIHDSPVNTREHIFESMKEYAEWYAKECLTRAAKQSKVIASNIEPPISISSQEDTECECWYIIDPVSITNINLPPHK